MSLGRGNHSKWASRFIFVAIVQGTIAAVLIAALLYLAVFGDPPASRIVASGSIGTWMSIGYIGFIAVAVLGSALCALFYQHIEVVLKRAYQGYKSILAWLHLLLMNVGALGAGGLMIWAGYIGGAELIQTGDTGAVHNLVAAYPTPIAIFMALGALGVTLGGFGYLMSWMSKPAMVSTAPS